MNKDLNKLSKEIFEWRKSQGYHSMKHSLEHMTLKHSLEHMMLKHSLEHMMCVVFEDLIEAVRVNRINSSQADIVSFYELLANSPESQKDSSFVEYYHQLIEFTVPDCMANAIIRILDAAASLGISLNSIDKESSFSYHAYKSEFSKRHFFSENIYRVIEMYYTGGRTTGNKLENMILHIDTLCEVMSIDVWQYVDLRLKYNKLL